MTIVGVDESGFGAWAGPVTVGAVATPVFTPFYWPEINDSKQIRSEDRVWLFKMMQDTVPWAVGMASHVEIDELGLGMARRLAAQRALTSLFAKYPLHPLQRFTELIIDGKASWGLSDGADAHNERWLGRTRCIVQADGRIKEVGAASICAKVVRDTWMRACAQDLPQWHFDANVGYHSPEHDEALAQYGPSVLHRRSVRPIAKMIAAQQKLDYGDDYEPDNDGDRRKHQKPGVRARNHRRLDAEVHPV